MGGGGGGGGGCGRAPRAPPLGPPLSIDIVGRKLMLMSLGALRVNIVRKTN